MQTRHLADVIFHSRIRVILGHYRAKGSLVTAGNFVHSLITVLILIKFSNFKWLQLCLKQIGKLGNTIYEYLEN